MLRAIDLNSPRALVIARVAVPISFGLYSLWRGADANWDLYNYHLYNPYAWLHGRMQIDLAPAGLQTYFNPLLDLPLYWMSEHLPARVVGFGMGALHGLVFLVLLGIAQRSLPILAAEDRYRVPLSLALAGCLTVAFLAEVGTSIGDDTTALFSLLALLVALANWPWLGSSTPRAVLVAIGCGLLVGLGAGLKLTNTVYAAAMCGALLSYPDRIPVRLRLGLLAGVGAVVGFGITGGYWLVHLWQSFGNPLYPQFGTIFTSPLTRPIAIADMRWFPRDAFEALLWPFIFSANPHRVAEIPMRQIIWPIVYLLFLAWVLYRLAAVRAQRDDVGLESRGRFIVLYVAIGYLLWLKLFSIHRYLVAIEVLTPVVAAVLLLRLLNYQQARRTGLLLIAAATLVVLTSRERNWGHEGWADPLYHAEIPLTAKSEQTVAIIVSADTPWAWLATLFPTDVAFTQLGGNFPAGVGYTERVHEMVRSRDGRAFAILKGANDAPQKRGGASAAEAREVDAENRMYIAQAAQLLSANGFVIDPASCAPYHAGIGKGVVVYQWCPLHER